MEIKHAQIMVNGRATQETIQLMHLTCPKCHFPVEYILSREDRFYKDEADHLRDANDVLRERLHRMKGIISRLMEK